MADVKEVSSKKRNSISLKSTGIMLAIFAFVISFFLIGSVYLASDRFNSMHNSMHNYMDWKESAMQVQLASDELTEDIRSFVHTKDIKHLKAYFDELDSNRRQDALNSIIERIPDSEPLRKLEEAVNSSQALENEEYAAMRAICEAEGLSLTETAYAEHGAFIANFDMSKSKYITDNSIDYVSYTNDQKNDLASVLVFGEYYESQKVRIVSNVSESIADLDAMMYESVHHTATQMKVILIIQQVLIGLSVLFLAGTVVLTIFYVVRPIRRAVKNLSNGGSVEVGRCAKEYLYLADTYNQVHEQNLLNQEKLAYEAEHDKLTGLYNRTGYDKIFRRVKLDRSVYILLDIDKFKSINDQHGHAVGDNVLVRVAKVLEKVFDGETSSVFRLGGDEFCVIVEEIEEENKKRLLEKSHKINEELKKDLKNCPGSSLSIGIAFGDINDTTDTLFKKADIALYHTKRNGRANATVYEFGSRITKD